MLGIRQVVVCVNKMDLVGYSQAHFEKIEKEYREFLAGIGAVSPKQFVPIAALHGDNLARRAESMPWYKGPTFLEVFDGFAKAPPRDAAPLRMPVQAVYKFTSHGDERRIVAGRIDAGTVKVGDKVVFSPSNKTALIRSIEGFNTAERKSIGAGWSTGFTLSEEIYITRGEVMSLHDRAPLVGTRLRANLIWLGKKPFTKDRDYKLKLGAAAMPVRIHKLLKVIDASTLDGELVKDHVGRHDVADVILECRQPLAYDLIGDCEATGRFVIVDGYDVAGGGIVTAAVTDDQDEFRGEARMRDFNWIKGGVTAAERAKRSGHQAALVMFVGKATNKQNYARALERALFSDGRQSYMLDGTNVLLGVDHDLTVDATQRELVRRFGEVAHLLLDAGMLLISTTNAIGSADHAAVQALIGDTPSLVIDVDPAGLSTAACDLRIRGSEGEAEVVAAITELLKARGITGT
jgi:bifunctional enzyme CysN/CysC